MSGRLAKAAVVALVLLMGFGCAHARLVEAHSNGGGVVAIPDNTNSWPSRNRRHAEDLMKKRCPQGYEIDFEGEEVVGRVAHTNTTTEQHRTPILTPLGLAPARLDTNQTTSYVDQKEWRIWFRPKGAPPSYDMPPGAIQPAAATIRN